MTGHIRVSGVWKNLDGASVRVGGTWKTVDKGFTRVAGVWKEWYSAALPSKIFINGGGAPPIQTTYIYDGITDVRSTGPNLPAGRKMHAGWSNSGTAGFFGTGNDASENPQSGVWKLNFTTLTFGSSFSIGSNSNQSWAVANGAVAGYVGIVSSNFYGNNYVRKHNFATDTFSDLYLTYVRGRPGGWSHNGTEGHWAGGYWDATPNPENAAVYHDKITYSTDTASAQSNLPVATRWPSGFGNSGVAGYIAGGGNQGGNLSAIRKCAFGSSAFSTLSATLSFANDYVSGAGIKGSHGIAQANLSVDKLSFATETRSSLTSYGSSVRQSAAMADGSGV